MNKLRPVSEAPVDGTVILIDEGFCKFQTGWPMRNQWVMCDVNGNIKTYPLDDESSVECPINVVFTKWMPVPEEFK